MLFQFGKLITNNQFTYPSAHSLKKFYELSHDDIVNAGYEAWAGGTSVSKLIIARDFDLYLTGEIKNIQELEDLIHRLYDYAINSAGFLLDCKWLESIDLYPTNPINEKNQIKVNTVDYIEISYIKYDIPERKIFKEYFFDARKNTEKITNWLVRGKFGNSYYAKKPQLDYCKEHGKMPLLPMKDFINSLG